MEIHGPVLWSLEAAAAFDLPARKARVEASGMKCVGLHTLGWGAPTRKTCVGAPTP